MIVDDSFNYHSLSLTIMFTIKRSMIVQDSLSKSRNMLASLLRIIFDTEVIPSLTLNLKALFQLHPDCGSHRKKCTINMAGPRTHLLGCIYIFSPFSLYRFQRHCRPKYSSKLLLCCSQDDGRYCIEPALVTHADRKTIVHYHPLGQTEKNYHELSCGI